MTENTRHGRTVNRKKCNKNILALVVVIGGSLMPQAHTADENQYAEDDLRMYIELNMPNATKEEILEHFQLIRDTTIDVKEITTSPGYSYSTETEYRTQVIDVNPQDIIQNIIPVRLSQGIISVITFIDSNMKTRQVKNVVYDQTRISVNGVGCNTETEQNREEPTVANNSHTINLKSCEHWLKDANAIVSIEKMSSPIVFRLSAGAKKAETRKLYTDAHTTVIVAEHSPNNYVGRLTSRRLNIDPLDHKTGGVFKIFMARNINTDIAFVDKADNKWPIESVVYNPQRVTVAGHKCAEPRRDNYQQVQADVSTGNVLFLALCQDMQSNIAVQLKNANAALSLLVVPVRLGEDKLQRTRIDATLTVKVPGTSPYIEIKGQTGAPSQDQQHNIVSESEEHYRDVLGVDPYLINFADGAIPQGAQVISIVGPPGLTGYIYNGALYLSGRYEPINPPPDAIVNSRSGKYAFRYDTPKNVLLVANEDNAEFDVVIDMVPPQSPYN